MREWGRRKTGPSVKPIFFTYCRRADNCQFLWLFIVSPNGTLPSRGLQVEALQRDSTGFCKGAYNMFLIVFASMYRFLRKIGGCTYFVSNLRVTQVNILQHTLRGGGCKVEAFVGSCGLRGSQQAAGLGVLGGLGFRAQGCQNYGPFLDPYYSTVPNILGGVVKK